MTSMAITGEVVEQPALVLASEWVYVEETATGLRFREDTPIEVWGGLTERLLRQEKRIHWAIADALNFGERYGEMYAQWVEETGLREKTLINIASVGRRVDRSRRREDVSFSHHEIVAKLPPSEQDTYLDLAVEHGMSCYDLRQTVKADHETKLGRAVDANGTPIEEPEPLAWVPLIGDLAPEARAELEQRLLGVGKRHRLGYTAGWLQALLWLGETSAFLPGRWRL